MSTFISQLQIECASSLRSLLEGSTGIVAAVVGMADGRSFAHAAQPDQEVDPARIAAIASSLLALSESFSGEALRSKALHSSIATAQGSIIIVRVPSGMPKYVLCLWTDTSMNFGMALHFANDCAAEIARVIDTQ